MGKSKKKHPCLQDTHHPPGFLTLELARERTEAESWVLCRKCQEFFLRPMVCGVLEPWCPECLKDKAETASKFLASHPAS